MRLNYLLFLIIVYVSPVLSQDNTEYKIGEGYHISHWGAEKDPNTFDFRLFRSINSNRSAFKDNFFYTVNNTFLPVIIGMPLGMITYGASTKRNYDENTGYLLSAAEITNLAITFVLKSTVKRLRPYLSSRNVYYRLILAQSLFSFPSGHTGTAICMSTIFALRYPSKPYIYLPMYAWSILIAYGRVYFGLHYPVDILGGAGVGLLSSVLVYSLRSDIIKLLKGKDARDSNEDFQSASISAGAFFLSSAANMFLTPVLKSHKNENFNISFSPVMRNNGDGIGIDLGW